MNFNRKLYSVALVSAALILFLIFVSSTASAQIEPEITNDVGDTSNEQVLSDEAPTEFDGIATESVQPAALKITEKRITTDEADSFYPVIYGNTIVWEDCRSEDGNWDIYMYNLSTSRETRITANSSDQYYPDVYGNRIVWEDWRNDDTNSNSDIYMYDLSTSKETPLITNENSGQRCPAIYGNKIVWMDWGRGDEDTSDIYMYDLSTSTETRLTTSGLGYYPDIYGNRIVWEEERNDNYDIYMYDLSTKKETRITTDRSDQLNPAIYGDRIVWEDWRNDDNGSISDIYMYNLSTKKETKITNSTSNSRYPAIYGNRIVWEDDRNGNWDIYVYDLATRQQTHTTEASAQYRPNIYGDKIVWEDVRNGNYDIYMGTLSSTSLVAAFSASPTSGNAPLKVKFTDKSTGSPISWKWNFGDGKTSTLKNPVHTYSKAGKYTVSLTVKNAAGSSTKTIKKYIVANELKAPVAAFSASPTTGKAPLKVQFTDKSANSPTSWKWIFGDGKTSTSMNPTHIYSKAGKYTVSLTVKNAKGSNTKTTSNYIIVKSK